MNITILAYHSQTYSRNARHKHNFIKGLGVIFCMSCNETGQPLDKPFN